MNLLFLSAQFVKKKLKKQQKSRLKGQIGIKNHLIRILIIVFIISIYAFFFPILYSAIGDGAFPIIHIIPVTAGYLLGLSGGLAFGAIASPIVIYLAIHAGYGFQDAIKAGIPAALSMMIVGASIGLFRNLIIRLRAEIEERQRTESELKKIKRGGGIGQSNQKRFFGPHESRTQDTVKSHHRLHRVGCGQEFRGPE